jgi:hypothetical protein
VGYCPGISVELASGNEDLRIDMAQSPASHDWFLPLELTVRRPVRVIWYSYELAAVPLALIALLGYQLSRSRRRGRPAPTHEITSRSPPSCWRCSRCGRCWSRPTWWD